MRSSFRYQRYCCKLACKADIVDIGEKPLAFCLCHSQRESLYLMSNIMSEGRQPGANVQNHVVITASLVGTV